jgi:hypothetical protein
MLLPIGEAVLVAVDVVNVNSPTLRTRSGTIVRFSKGTYDIDLEEDAPDLETGTRLVLNLRDGARRRVTATVCDRTGLRLRAQEHRTTSPDNRDYPRLAGGVPLRYRVANPKRVDTEVDRWMSGDVDEAPRSAWRSPDPFMNFSVTGLRFDDEALVSADDILLCELGIGASPERWRAVASVVRVAALEPGELDLVVGERYATHSIAVHFIALPPDAGDALTHYAIRLQRAQL